MITSKHVSAYMTGCILGIPVTLVVVKILTWALLTLAAVLKYVLG